MPSINETSVPAMAKVAKPAASAMRKYLGEMTINRAAIKRHNALAIEAIKKIWSEIGRASCRERGFRAV